MKRVAAALDAARRDRSRLGKEERIAEGLRAVASDAGDEAGRALAVAARMAAGRALPLGDGRSIGVGSSLMLETVVALTGFDARTVWASARRCGELAEAFALLMARDARSHAREGVPLLEVADLFDTLAASARRSHKRQCLDAVFARATPLETKYLARAILGGLRIGAQSGVLEAAIGRAFGVELERVRRAAGLVTDPGDLAVLARDGRLEEARLELGRPVAYMLATPMESVVAPVDPALFVVEDKIDGVRAQIHKVGAEVSIFGRGLDRLTGAFPDVVDAVRFIRGELALDGELVAVDPADPSRVRPFQALQSRLRRVAPTRAMLDAVPARFVAYDLLADGVRDLTSLPWAERRAHLERVLAERAPTEAVILNAYRRMADVADLDRDFDEARGRGHEGLVLKRSDAPYEAGRRGQAWIKVKKAFATLDVVVTAVQEGTGRRAGTLSDYTFGVWRGDELVNVGKAYSGLTDEEIDTLGKRFVRSTRERLGGVRLVEPEVVVEVGFDGVQRSARHKSGFALRFPRIVRIRTDKSARQADTLEAVEALFQAQVGSGHREEASPEPARGRTKRLARVPDTQLDLFGQRERDPRARKMGE